MKTNKKKLIILLPFLAMSLASCTDTDELYRGDQYIGGGESFADNRYNVWYSPLQDDLGLVTDFDVPSSKRFSGSGDDSNPSGYGLNGYGDLANKHPEAIQYTDSNGYTAPLPWLYNGMDKMPSGVGQWTDNTPLVGEVYGQTKKMSLIDSTFSKGILSKLYNGQIRCDGWNSYAYLQLDQHGYGALFPKELNTADYFAMVIRGGSNTDASVGGRLSSFDLQVNFYKFPYSSQKYDKYTFNLSSVILETNISAENTSLVGFYFKDFDFDPKGIVGMSVNYSIKDDSEAKGYVNGVLESVTTSSDMDQPADYYLCLMLYEVFFPDSSWN